MKTIAVEVTEQECYRIYNWASRELMRLQNQASDADRPMTDAETMFPDAWRNNQAVFDKFLRLYRIHRGWEQPANGYEIPLENATIAEAMQIVDSLNNSDTPRPS